MTDKVQKIREKIEKLKDELNSPDASSYTEAYIIGATHTINSVLDIIDSLQEEPVSSIWHDASEPPIIDKTFLLIAPNGNSSLCLWGGKELHSVTIGGGHSVLCKGDIYSYIDDLLNLDNSCNFGKNWKKLEEPVSEDLEEAAKHYLYSNILYDDVYVGEPTDKDCIEMFNAGAKWQKENLWKPSDGDDLPEYEREVVAFQEIFPTDVDVPSLFKIVIAHRPNPEGYDGKSLTTGGVEHYTPETYGKGGWNIPDVKWWLDCSLPNMEED